MRKCPKCHREWGATEEVIFCPSDGALVTNLVLNGKYRLENLLNEGGMGTVYRATHLALDKTVAIKVLSPRLLFSDISRKRFLREARYTAELQHDNIIQVFDLDEENGITYFVMELLEGLDLRQKMQQQGRMTYNEIAHILNQTCTAVHAAHSRGILHRDLKPANIFLTPTDDGLERIKVLDFGIAKLVAHETQSLTADGAVVGTPEYVSPEQACDEILDARSDVYSLGVILYEMLTRQVPFRASMPALTLLKHINEKPTPLRSINSDIPQAVENVVLQALEKKREHRQQSAAQLAQEFSEAIENCGTVLYGQVLSIHEFETMLIDRGQPTSQRRGRARYFTETLPGDIALEMIYVPGGTFLMGSPKNEPGRSSDEGPQHQVTLSPFFLGKFQITQEQWRVVAGLPKQVRHLNPDPAYFKDPNRPVEQVSWDDAVEFCQRLSHSTGKAYRLPTEAEWEYACRAGTTTPFSCGESITTEVANFNGSGSSVLMSSKGKARGETVPVGNLGMANNFGLYDMHGNVWEWCSDWFSRYTIDPVIDPKGPARGSGRVNRGGSWFSLAANCRSANRGSLSPGSKLAYLGLRVAACIQ
ncbi:MAG: SUMF1/EgtB/PvdO family nonheme iron enzyme [Acidobacteria bacterium]|nr:SUMF1/EgtB/PvdO family nonheme iron enzyme [Acidobacteriota bacterium]